MIQQTLTWHRPADELPTADHGPTVLVHIQAIDHTVIHTVDTVRAFGLADGITWWASLPRPRKERS